METVIKIDGKDIPFKSTGSAPLRYKMQFKRDFFADLIKLKNGFTGKSEMYEILETIDLEVFYNIAWICAKTADPTIPSPMEWLDTFDTFPIIEIAPQLQDILFASLGTINTKK